MAVIASIFVALAALLHGYIFVLESVRWTNPRTWKTFNVPSQEQAEVLKPMAYNQGFYNLFLGVGAAFGLILYWSGSEVAGAARCACLLAREIMECRAWRRE